MKNILKGPVRQMLTAVIGWLLFLPVANAQQKIDLIEYSIDVAPAYGQATAVTVPSPNADISNFSFNANISSVADGFHTLYVRSHSSAASPANSVWGATNYQYFFKASTLGAATSKVKKLEYFMDTDPGIGHATTINVTAATQVSGIAFNPNIAALTNGFHVLYIRSLDQDGKWSITNYQYFYKQSKVPAPISTISKLEYFIDTDPGAGKGTSINVSPATNVSGLSFNADVAVVNPGFHAIFIRSRDGNGKWSITNYSYFYKAAPQANTAANIVKIEYFIDADPGYAKAINLPVTPANDIANKNFSADVSGLAKGVHYMNVRSLDSRGKWSIVAFDTFNVNSTLAVGLLHFDAAKENDFVKVFWQTTLEQNINRFEVEHSTNGIHFLKAGSVKPLNNPLGSSYTFRHLTPQDGSNFYRLKTVDNDGSFNYSAVKLVNFTNNPLVTLFPNPADKYFIIKTAIKNLRVEVLTTDGKLVKTISTENANTQVDVSMLSSGLYNVRIHTANSSANSFVLIMH